MKLKDYLDEINGLVKEHPEALELPVVYAVDDEGNNYHHIVFGPTIGTWPVNGEDLHSVCIN